jgi:hypothetical protein
VLGNGVYVLRLGVHVDAIRVDAPLGLRALAYLRVLGEHVGPVLARRRGMRQLYFLVPAGTAEAWPCRQAGAVKPIGAGALLVVPQRTVNGLRWLHCSHAHDGRPTDPAVLLTALEHGAARLRRAQATPEERRRLDEQAAGAAIITALADCVPWSAPIFG